MKNVLFLCTGNSARSIMAEAYMNDAGAGRWRAWSAGSKPVGAPNPFALETLAAHGIPTVGARSKSWDEFAGGSAPAMDAVITVCDNAAGEICPIWPTQNGAAPRKLHWSFPDPASVAGDDDAKREAFAAIFAEICTAIDLFLEEGAS